MNNQERLFLLKELNEVEQLVRRKKEVEKYPFLKIFELYLKGTPIKNIAKKAMMDPLKVSQIINGSIPIPRFKVNQIKRLGFKICSSCKHRIVPLEPINYITLTRLCVVCWKNKTTTQELENFVSGNIHKNIY